MKRNYTSKVKLYYFGILELETFKEAVDLRSGTDVSGEGLEQGRKNRVKSSEE